MPNLRIGGTGLPLSLNGMPTNTLDVNAGSIWMIPSGTWKVTPGLYTTVQWKDPISGIWRTIGNVGNKTALEVQSDGGNYRVANLTGCPIGALITNAGTGYTDGIGTAATGCTITASAGSSVWVPVVGGGINTTVTITTAGTNYTKPPTLLFSAPPVGGIPATGYCTISGGAINAVTITNGGAGYTSAPSITVQNDSAAPVDVILDVNAYFN